MNLCNKIIEYSFYSLFILVPLIFMGNTSELFEFNKMWFTFGATTIIAATWIIKMILQKRFSVQRTPLDIPILLFLLSQIIATLISLDPHVSWWGYYSRFNGGLLSTITYIVLYYTFVSNLQARHVVKSLKVILVGGLLVTLWGLPSHFGADPTCLVFRGTLDTSCWTEAFKPTIRAFSTLGQPAWLAAYLAALLPIAMAFFLNNKKKKPMSRAYYYFGLTAFFYLLLLFTNTRAGFLAFAAANIIFWAVLLLKKFFTRKVFLTYFLLFNSMFVLFGFVFGVPIEQLYNYTLPKLTASTQAAPSPSPVASEAAEPAPAVNHVNITDSGNIRLYVWQGAIDAWKANPVFGTGVETFAYAYYQHKPPGHNLTSEWDYLYNKAHNEYLNYLATTGVFGLGTYLIFLLGVVVVSAISLFKKKTEHSHEFDQKTTAILILGLGSGWTSILVSNFFGFSVVIINIFLFLLPLFILMLASMVNPEKTLAIGKETEDTRGGLNWQQWTGITSILIISSYLLIGLMQYWYADTKYALGSNLSKVGSFQEGYPLLLEAVQTIPNEPIYQDELALTTAVLATALIQHKDIETGTQFAKNAIMLDDTVVREHPNNVVFWKNRVRLFYTLAQADPQNQQAYYQEALKAIQKAHALSPTDAKISYNLGVLTGQTGDTEQAVTILEETVTLKPDYKDAYVALGLFYHELAIDDKEQVVKPEFLQKAIKTYEFVLAKIDPTDKQVKESLASWKN